MKKKGVAFEFVSFIILLITLFVLVAFAIQYREFAKQASNKEAVRLWVIELGKKQQLLKNNAPVGRPPVGQLIQEPFLINTEEQLKRDINPLLANAMLECSEAFVYGDINFLGKWAENVFCYPCATFSFSKELKAKNGKVVGLKKFLAENKPIAGSKNPTYAEILTNKNEKLRTITGEENDIIPTDNDLFVFFIATTSSGWGDIIIYATIGNFAGIFFPGVGNIVGAGGGALIGALTAAFTPSEFESLVVVSDANFINGICNKR